MSKHYEAPVELRQLEKMLTDFTYHNGYEISNVFDNWLEFIIWSWSLDGKPIEGWRYKKEENKFFYDLLCEWIKVMEKQLVIKEWYDLFGTLYESIVASKSRRDSKGQFFTPPSLCDLMVQLNPQSEKKMVLIVLILAAVVVVFYLLGMYEIRAITYVQKILIAAAA